MKILVLGGSGLIGGSLLQNGAKSFNMISTYNKNKIKTTNVKSIHISLPTEINSLNEFIKKEIPNVVINTMAYSNVDFCELHQKETYQLHVEMTEKLFDICSEINSKLILISTDYVFDGKKGFYSEENESNPINYYGYTKALSEKIVLKNPQNAVLRTASVYGWNPQVRFLNFVLNNLKKGNEIFVYDNIIFSPTLIDELVESILKVASTNAHGIFHTVGSSCISKFNFAEIIAKKFGLLDRLVRPIETKEKQPIAKRPFNTCLDNSKAKKILNINFSTVEEGLNKIVMQSHSIT